MRFFAYHGTDSQGRTTQGTIQAASADEAKRLLVGGGVRTAAVRELSAAGVPTAPSRPPASSVQTAPRPAIAAAPAEAGMPREKIRFAGNHTSFFLFESLARYLKSGIAPNRALEELGQRARKAWLGERLLQASAAVGRGASLADALEACNCFPTGCVGTIRAGEASGAVPDALLYAAAGCEQAHKLSRRCSVMVVFFAVLAIYLPFGIAFVAGSLDAVQAQDVAGGNLSPGGTAAAKIAAQLRRTLPLAIPWYVLVFVLWRLWLSPAMRPLRHRVILRTPILAGRAKEESLARLSWALTELSRAGMPPNRALLLAADAAPNLEMAGRFREESGRMMEQDRLSTALGRTRLMSPELVDIVENGELAGDVPGAISSVHRATTAEFERKDGSAHTKIWFVLYPIVGILVGITVASLMKTLYLGLMRIILGES